MTKIALSVNGKAVSAEIEPRTSLADFLREHLLLTGTHLGCEHGVCGACNVLIDGEPARSCITLAAVCGEREVHTIEGLVDDVVMVALRAAFTAEHALQCGYCTPGMLVTARDIVRRLPDADDDRIRLELAGNLCRCTGYNGIVRAIRRVLDARLDVMAPVRPRLARGRFSTAELAVLVSRQPDQVLGWTPSPQRGEGGGEGAPKLSIDRNPPHPSPLPDGEKERAALAAGGERLSQTMHLRLPRDVVWDVVRDPALVASCVPGARLDSVDNGEIAGELLVSLGPIRVRFGGTASVSYDIARHAGRIVGQGNDRRGTRLGAEASFRVEADGPQACTIVLDVAYSLRGPLAQLGRGPVVRAFAAEIAAAVANNLEARLRGEPLRAPRRLGVGGLIVGAIWRRLRALLLRRHE